MRALHIVKTSDGAEWAALLAQELVRLGIELHVALPNLHGRMMPEWRASGAVLHAADLDFPARKPWLLPAVCRLARRLVREVSPDLIHIQNVGPALVLRQALRGKESPPRLFHVPGPLHLEHRLYRALELSRADEHDFWIASCRAILQLYRDAGVSGERLFLSYYGKETSCFRGGRTNVLRERLGIAADRKVVGNISFIYPPKRMVGQRIGLKAHEDLIDGLGIVLEKRPDVVGVLIGGTWGGSTSYEESLRARAIQVGRGRIHMPGFLPPNELRPIWPDFDCAIHVPLTEGCAAAVIDPLLSGVPTIAGRVGGLTDIVIDGITGRTVPIRQPAVLAERVLELLADPPAFRLLTANGRRLAETMFDIRRTGPEMIEIYRHVLDRRHPRPPEFDSYQAAQAIAAEGEIHQARI